MMLKKIYWNYFKRNISGITSSLRVLPNFIIIGSMKSGTTSLYYNICQHPCVLKAAYDEIGFFDSNYNLGLNWYRSMFPTKKKMEGIRLKEGISITGEDTPFYFWNPSAAKRIKDILPNIKLISILRNPIDRAYSEYQDLAITDTNFPSFEEMIDDEIETRVYDELIITEENFETFNQKKSYLLKGIYVDQLKIWNRLFARKQILTISSEDLKLNPQETLKTIFEFLNLSNYKIETPQYKKQKKYVAMNPETREKLIEFYKPHNERLFKFMGKKFDWDG
jgi:hypothetical protein